MAPRLLPRYFVSRADAPESVGLSEDVISPTHAVDCFTVGSRHLHEREWVVTTDSFGHLLASPDEGRALFSEKVQAELAYQEISGHNCRRLLEVSEFYLFNLQFLEQSAAAPGVNDAVYLYGTLFGPYPARDQKFPAGVEGQLTVTRADLLDGLVHGAQYAFRYAGESGEGGAPPRCFHSALPADREDEIGRGCGVVLAYPLLPPEVALDDVTNEIVVCQLLYDTLRALKEDLARERVNHPLGAITLPVPSRFTLEQQLRAEGYEINGDTAVRRAKAGGGFQGLLASVFGSSDEKTLRLPPEGEADDFLDLARLTLNALPGWPAPRVQALRRRIRPAPPGSSRGAQHQPSIPPPVKTPATNAAPPRVRQQAGAASGGPPAWVQDFMQSHRQPGEPEPRLTAVTAPQPRAKQPGWMRDFERDSTAPDREPKPPAPAGRPEWMSDFE
jgi:hypothetical protein